MKLILKNFSNDIDTILSDDQAFTHNMSMVIPQAQREAEMELKFREQQINEQRRMQGQESQPNAQPQGMNLYNMGYQQFLRSDRDKEGEKDKEEGEELDQKMDENIERLMVDMDYFKHQKNKEESNDDKSK